MSKGYINEHFKKNRNHIYWRALSLFWASFYYHSWAINALTLTGTLAAKFRISDSQKLAETLSASHEKNIYFSRRLAFKAKI
jgi:hypothetical protein